MDTPEYINLYDSPSFSRLIGKRKVYPGEGSPYIKFNKKDWFLCVLVKLSDTDYMLPEGRLIET